MNELVSIITPTYNSSKFIGKCIESVINQTYPNWEMIIVDDYSRDDSLDIITKFMVKDKRIKVIQNLRNQGSAISRNKAIKNARGRYIAFLDSDDSWKANKLEKQIGFMQSKDLAFTYGDYSIIDKKTSKVISTFVVPEKLSYADLLRSCPIGCLTAVYDQTKLGKVYMPDVRQGQDWGLWLALTRDGTKAYRYPGCEAFYSVGKSSLSTNKLQKSINMFRIYRYQESQSFFSSIYYLFRHTLYVLGK